MKLPADSELSMNWKSDMGSNKRYHKSEWRHVLGNRLDGTHQ